MPVDNPYPEERARDGLLHALIGSVIEAVPIIGPAVASISNEVTRQAQARRVEEWGAMVTARLSALERAGLPVDVNDAEFLAAIARLQRAANETADAEKRSLLALVAANAGAWSTEPYARRGEYVELVSALSPAEIAVLAYCDDVKVPEGVDADISVGFGVSYGSIYLYTDRGTTDIRDWIEAGTGVPTSDAWRMYMAISTRGLLADPRAQSFDGPIPRFTTEFGHDFVEYLRNCLR